MKLNGKQLFIIGILALLLFTIPLTLFFVKQQQDLRSSAAPSSNLSLIATNSPVSVGETVYVDVMLDPGNNIPSFIKFSLQYDPQKVSLTAMNPDIQNISTTLDGPNIDNTGGLASVEFGINKAITGYDTPDHDITQPFKVATLEFEALETTDTPTQVTFDFPASTQVLSIATEDGPGENVLVNASPTLITILGGTDDPQPTATPPATLTPSIEPNEAPVCASLIITPSSGSASLLTQFTAVGNDPDGQISKATFNFGDGQVIDTLEGLGTKTVTVQQSHTYTAVGSHSATVVFTDNRGKDSAACTQQVTVLAASSSAQPTIVQATPVPQATSTIAPPAPTLAAPGSIGTAIGIGGAVILTVIGGILFLIL